MNNAVSTYLRGLFAAAMLILPVAAQAGQPFDATQFMQAQEAGKPILVEVAASWCATCAKQKPIIESLEASQPNLVVFEVDFDTGKDLLKRFNAPWQSTLIVYKGAAEIGRSTGETNPAAIRDLVAKAL
ncbi:MAG TPA: thioredoxin family protein [Magnetospirillum sp.]|nr:thioredoxin family protein [Magnetospirillum sp.]